MSRRTLSIELKGSVALGGYPTELAQLTKIITSRFGERSSDDRLELAISTDWFDLGLLSYFAQLLTIAQNCFSEIHMQVLGPAIDKFPFLWQVGFWQLIRANRIGSILTCDPDPWTHQPKQARSRSNYTPLVIMESGGGENAVHELVRSWDELLRETTCFPAVQDSDIMLSREYLYLLLWELLHNACIHSGSTHVALSGQLFISSHDMTLLRPYLSVHQGGLDDPNAPRFVENLSHALSRQHTFEVEYSTLPSRRDWLLSHKSDSFLLLCCTDCGMGIPSSLAQNGRYAQDKDHELLQKAFSPWTSTRRADPTIFDVHGLSQVRRLVDDYDGYLFVQSGLAFLESTHTTGLAQVQSVSPGSQLAGSLFQVLLPLGRNVIPKPVTSVSVSRLALDTRHADPRTEETLIVFEELRSAGHSLSPEEEQWAPAVRRLIDLADCMQGDIVYVDLACIPRNRQFLSYLLRCLRRTQLPKSVVVVNASPEVIGVAKSLQRLDVGDISDEDVKVCRDLDRDLSLALSRGDIACLPLLLPLAMVDQNGSTLRLVWLGLGGLDSATRCAVQAVLDHLFGCEGGLAAWDEIWVRARDAGSPGSLQREVFLPHFRSIVRSNPSLFEWNEIGCSLRLSPYGLYRKSYSSLRQEISDRLVPLTKHTKSEGKEDYLYSLAWHAPTKRFRKWYYRTWNVLSDRESRTICGQMLLRLAYSIIGEAITKAVAIVSATPSAGLLGREIAGALGADFWEVPSVYEIDNTDWLPTIGGPVILVDDVLDTGRLTHKLISRLKQAEAECLCVITLLRNSETEVDSGVIPCPIVAGISIALGIPSESEVTSAIEEGKYFEIDPHTLEPMEPNPQLTVDFGQTEKDRLRVLASEGAILSNHFQHGEHHYNLYFSLPDALACPSTKDMLLDWVMKSIASFADEKQVTDVTLVYPYYSPIYKLIDLLASLWPHSEYKRVRLRFAVARPCQLTGGRMGYTLADVVSSHPPTFMHAVVIDDGIATGGTFAAIMEELVARDAVAVRALILFDRIGLQPRRHLRHIKAYRTANNHQLDFSFQTFLSANLRSHFSRDCPECILTGRLAGSLAHARVFPDGVELLKNLLRKTIVGSRRSPVKSRLDPSEVMSVMGFYNAVLSDLPSPRQMAKALASRKRSSPARLEVLSAVIRDAKLFRQVTDRQQCLHWINECMTDTTVGSEARARFVLYTTLCADQSFAFTLLTEQFPQSFAELAQATASASLNRYFDSHGLEFLSAAAALHMLHEQVGVATGIDDRWVSKWQDALSTPEGVGASGASIYSFILGTLFLGGKELAVEQALYLVASFVGSYSQHGEGLLARLTFFQHAVNDCNYIDAIQIMPPEMFLTLLEYIRDTQLHFQVSTFGESDLADLRDSYLAWQRSKEPEHLSLTLSKHLLSPSPLTEMSTMDDLVATLTPRVGSLIEDALVEFRENTQNVQEVNITVAPAVESERVFATAPFATKVVSHLLTNALEAWNRLRTRAENTAVDPLILNVNVEVSHKDAVTISVTDNVPFDGDSLDVFFMADGALMAHRFQLKLWKGDLLASLMPGGLKRFTVRLKRIHQYDGAKDADE